MAQPDQPKKIEFNWVSLLIIIGLAVTSAYFGARLSKKQQENIAEQAVLQAQRDSTIAVAKRLEVRVRVLEAEVDEANKNTNNAEKQVLSYKKKYKELSGLPAVHDTVKIEECDKLVERYDNYTTVLKANILSYIKLTDTLQLENKYLGEAYAICVTLSTKQGEELTQTRSKLRRSKIVNFGMSGALAGAIIVLLVR